MRKQKNNIEAKLIEMHNLMLSHFDKINEKLDKLIKDAASIKACLERILKNP